MITIEYTCSGGVIASVFTKLNNLTLVQALRALARKNAVDFPPQGDVNSNK